MQSGTLRLDLHGMNCTQARAAIDAALRGEQLQPLLLR